MRGLLLSRLGVAVAIAAITAGVCLHDVGAGLITCGVLIAVAALTLVDTDGGIE